MARLGKLEERSAVAGRRSVYELSDRELKDVIVKGWGLTEMTDEEFDRRFEDEMAAVIARRPPASLETLDATRGAWVGSVMLQRPGGESFEVFLDRVETTARGSGEQSALMVGGSPLFTHKVGARYEVIHGAQPPTPVHLA